MRICFLILFCFSTFAFSGESPLSLYARHKPFYYEGEVSVEDFYDQMKGYYEAGRWRQAVGEATSILALYPDTRFAAEAAYYKGVIYYEIGRLQKADRFFSYYLDGFTDLKFYYEAFRYKFLIAEEYYSGVGKHLLGHNAFPKWASTKEDALRIYDEISSGLPRDEMCVTSLYNKGKLLAEYQDYQESIESFQTLIRRFPKHPLARESFLQISSIFYQEARNLFPDPDLLQLNDLNVEKFKAAFPGDPKIEEARQYRYKMEEIFAQDLFEMGSYYRKKKKWDAAQIYYQAILKQYPTTQVAQKVSRLLH